MFGFSSDLGGNGCVASCDCARVSICACKFVSASVQTNVHIWVNMHLCVYAFVCIGKKRQSWGVMPPASPSLLATSAAGCHVKGLRTNHLSLPFFFFFSPNGTMSSFVGWLKQKLDTAELLFITTGGLIEA